MSLIHHIAHEENFEALYAIKTLPYFKDIIDDDNNEVSEITKNDDPYKLDGIISLNRF
jgi:hypothetical protein